MFLETNLEGNGSLLAPETGITLSQFALLKRQSRNKTAENKIRLRRKKKSFEAKGPHKRIKLLFKFDEVTNESDRS